MNHLSTLFTTLNVAATFNYNGQYCGAWSVDTSGNGFINFHIVSHGQCYLHMPNDESSTLLQKGDMMLFPRDSQHQLASERFSPAPLNQAQMESYERGVLEDATGLVCGHFSYDHPIMNNVVSQLADVIIIRASDTEQAALKSLLVALVEHAKQTGTDSMWVLNKIADAVMALLLQTHLKGNKGILALVCHPQLSQATSQLLEQPGQKWSVEQLAEMSFMSRTRFASLFKEVAGMAPMEFVTYWRLSQAYQWLASGTQTTLGAALACGYDNESSFSKAFKRVLGVSPGAVRKQKTA